MNSTDWIIDSTPVTLSKMIWDYLHKNLGTHKHLIHGKIEKTQNRKEGKTNLEIAEVWALEQKNQVGLVVQ